MTAAPIRGRPLAAFFVLAFGITWAVWVPRAAGVPVGAAGDLWTWVPAVAALLAAALVGGRAAVAELGSRLVRWRVGWRWYAVVVLGPAAFSLAVAALYALLGGAWAEAAPPFLRGGTSPPLLPLFFAGPPAAAGAPQRPGCQSYPRGAVGGLAPAAGVDRGLPAVRPAHLAAPPGHDGQVGAVHLGVPAHAGQRAHRGAVARHHQPVRRLPGGSRGRGRGAPAARGGGGAGRGGRGGC